MNNKKGKSENTTPSELLLLQYSSIHDGKEFDKGFFMNLLSSVNVVDIDIIDTVIFITY